MTIAERKARLLEIRQIVSIAADEIHKNGDTFASIDRLAEALELLLIFLEQEERDVR